MLSRTGVTLILFLPLLFVSVVPLLLRRTGHYLSSQSQGRRDGIVALAKKELNSSSQPESSSSSSSSSNDRGDDSDWEHVPTSQTSSNKSNLPPAQEPTVIGFFHPFSHAGGGGERVLWAAIRATQLADPTAICAVYTGDHNIDRDMVVSTVKNKFAIELRKATLHLVYLTKRDWVLASSWPHFTLLGQSLGSLLLAWDALGMWVPDVFIDTMGYAFAVAMCKILFPHVPTGAYVHYPTISTDMLDSLQDKSGVQGVNSGAGAGVKGMFKKQYWHLFARLYGWVGRHIDVVMCNSTWTRDHVAAIWKRKSPPTVVYPPCPVQELEQNIKVSQEIESKREHMILYIAQFRPEKNHSLILRAFAKYLHQIPENEYPRLVLIGSVRTNHPDERHVYNLRLEARELKINSATTFVCDASFSQIQEYLQKASIGVNGMWNEHFGIGVVEYLAAGLIPVVHDSGGPKLDIVIPHDGQRTGFHAETDEQFADAFRQVRAMTPEDRVAMRLRARESAKRFTEEVFVERWTEGLHQLMASRTK